MRCPRPSRVVGSFGVASEWQFCTYINAKSAIDLIVGVANPSDLNVPDLKRPRELMYSQAHPVPKRATRSSISTPISNPVGNSGRMINPKTHQAYASTRRARKPGNSRLRQSAPPAFEDEKSTEVENATLATLSLLRSSSHRKPPASELKIRLDLSPLLSLSILLINWQRLRHPAQILSAVPLIPTGRSASPTVRAHPLTCF